MTHSKPTSELHSQIRILRFNPVENMADGSRILYWVTFTLLKCKVALTDGYLERRASEDVKRESFY